MEHLHAHYSSKETETAQQKVETGELHSELHKRGAMIAELTAQSKLNWLERSHQVLW